MGKGIRKVLVNKASNEKSWYADKIGETFVLDGKDEVWGCFDVEYKGVHDVYTIGFKDGEEVVEYEGKLYREVARDPKKADLLIVTKHRSIEKDKITKVVDVKYNSCIVEVENGLIISKVSDDKCAVLVPVSDQGTDFKENENTGKSLEELEEGNELANQLRKLNKKINELTGQIEKLSDRVVELEKEEVHSDEILKDLHKLLSFNILLFDNEHISKSVFTEGFIYASTLIKDHLDSKLESKKTL